MVNGGKELSLEPEVGFRPDSRLLRADCLKTENKITPIAKTSITPKTTKALLLNTRISISEFTY